MVDQLQFLAENLDTLLIGFPGNRPGGLLMSILLTLVALMVGLLMAWPIGLGLRSTHRPVRYGCQLYVWIFRGLPLILLLVTVHQLIGNSRYGLDFTPLTSALVTLTLYSSAYQSGVVASGLESLPEGLSDTAKTLAASRWQRWWWVEGNYIIRVMLPAFLGEALSLFKDSSIVVVLGVAELLTVARLALGTEVGNASYWVGMYLLVGLLYFLVAACLSWAAQRWEERHRPDHLMQFSVTTR